VILRQDSGEGWAFFANGISYLFVIVGLFFVRTKSYTVQREGPRFSIKQMVEGIQYIRQDRVILVLISMVAILSFFGAPFSQQIPVFARDVFSSPLDNADSVAARNSLMVSFQGLGALIASISLAIFSTSRRKGMVLTLGQFAFGAALVGISLTKSVDLTYLLIAMAGWGQVSQMALTNTMIQQKVPDNLRGRVISTYLWVLQGATPFGSLLIGSVAQSLGAPIAVLLGGSICLIAYSVIHLRNKYIRQLKL
jgi:MFS family permease